MAGRWFVDPTKEISRLRAVISEMEAENAKLGTENWSLKKDITSIGEARGIWAGRWRTAWSENRRLREALVEERAKIQMIEEQYDIDVDLEWEEAHGGYRGGLRKEVRAALGGGDMGVVVVPYDALDWIFRSLCAYLDYVGHDSRCYDPKGAVEAIRPYVRGEAAPQSESPRWIPVSEDDPEEDTLVFVANMDASFKSITIGMFNGQRWRTWNNVGIYVTHWMELPFPDWPKDAPQEGEDDS